MKAILSLKPVTMKNIEDLAEALGIAVPGKIDRMACEEDPKRTGEGQEWIER